MDGGRQGLGIAAELRDLGEEVTAEAAGPGADPLPSRRPGSTRVRAERLHHGADDTADR